MNGNTLGGADVIRMEARRARLESLATLPEGKYPIPFETDGDWDGVALLTVCSEHLALDFPLADPDVRFGRVLLDERGDFEAGHVRIGRSSACEIAVHGSLQLREGRLQLEARVKGNSRCGRGEREISTVLRGDGSARPARA